jgi:diguanylate cyclase (GGDEF)-like protein
MTSSRRTAPDQARSSPSWAVLTVLLGLHIVPGAVIWWAHLGAAPGSTVTAGTAEPFAVLAGSGLLILAETVAVATALLAVRLPLAIAGPMLSCAGVVVARLLLDGLSDSGLERSGLVSAALLTPAWNNGTDLVIGLGTLWVMWSTRRMIGSRQQLLDDRAERDALTGLLGRAGLGRRLSELSRLQDVALVMFDLNDLKSINDTGGHSAGDSHLKRVAAAIEATLPSGGLLGRWGGDEFLAALPLATLDEAHAFAERAAQGAPRPRRNLPPFSVGAAQMRAGEDMARALAVADQQLYENKAASRLEAAARLRGVYIPSPEEFTRMLEGLETKHAILKDGLDALRLMLGFDGSSYYEQRGELLYPTYVTGDEETELARISEVSGRVTSRGIVSRALQTGATVGTADYPSDPLSIPEWRDQGLKSVVVTSVRDAGQTVGILDLTSYRTWRAITPQVCRLLEAVALRLGHVLERDRVIAQVQHTFEGSLVALGTALEARDFESYGHTERVVAAAELLGSAFDLGVQTQLELRQGAYLHDIGKLTIPDAVLLKPGKLDAAEMEQMRRHAAQGHALASRIEGISAHALDVILSHHEHWDGLGYPAGLSGEQIPLLARIFAVCDVYDALTSARPYKPAWTVEAALRELEAQAGKQFDPRIVTIFSALVSSDPGRLLSVGEGAATSDLSAD